ncbi:hypothetical protein BaRGS_00004148 [Batillaria attramentaria]|uniref:CRAL-TRIO domain-containing protein n=1 Tax=Batillaria attramentaria TaxID=370345 RepID=A0ABD0LYS8_9CAEN
MKVVKVLQLQRILGVFDMHTKVLIAGDEAVGTIGGAMIGDVCLPTDSTSTTVVTEDSDTSREDSTSATFPEDSTWPLTHDDAVLVHLCEATPAAHLVQDGDFYFCLRRSSADDASCEYRRTFSSKTMDWVEKARSAPDHELSYILRQCLIATEYTVRHLQWEEVLERNGLHLGGPFSGPASYGRQDVSSDSDRASRRDSNSDAPSGGYHSCNEQASADSSVSSRRDSHGQGCDLSDGSASDASGATILGARQRTASASDSPGDVNGVGGGDSVRTSGCASDDMEADSRTRSGSGGEGNGSDTVGVDTSHGGGRLRNGSTSDSDRSPSSRGSPSTLRRDRTNSTYYTRRHLEAPQTITDLDYQLLHSGIAILPEFEFGTSDLSGKRLIFIFTCSVLWHNRQVVSAELTRLLMYYFSIPRRELMSQGVTIVVDVRGATSSTVNILLESLYLFKDNIPNSVSVIHVLADKPTQSLVLKSPVYDPQSGVGVDLILSQEMLLRSVSLDQLPPALDGTFPYSHEEWVRFRMRVEPFLTNCVTVAQYLVEVMQEISSSDFLPRSSQATRELIERHEAQVKTAFNDPRLLSIQNDGEAIMSSLRREESSCCHSEDYRHALEKVSSLYRQLQDTMSRLAHLADTRLNRLEQCLQLRGFEEECDKVGISHLV